VIRVPRGTHSDATRLVLPSWLTPAFARRWLAQESALSDRPHHGDRYSQADRYAAIAREQDWTGQGRRLVWLEPYASVPPAQHEPVEEPPPADESDAARRFGQLASAAIREGRVEALVVNDLLADGQAWSVLLGQLQRLLAME